MRTVSYTHLDVYKRQILPFADNFPQDNELYSIMTTRLSDLSDQSRPGEAAAETE